MKQNTVGVCFFHVVQLIKLSIQLWITNVYIIANVIKPFEKLVSNRFHWGQSCHFKTINNVSFISSLSFSLSS